MKKIFLTTLLILTAIFLVGLITRLYRLDINTPPLYSDETGGHYLFFSRINGPSLPYLSRVIKGIITIPTSTVWLSGFSTFAARLPSAINGTLLILVSYIFSLEISRKIKLSRGRTIALVCSGLVAILPWSYMISRLYGNIPFVTLLVLLHIILLIRSNKIRDYLFCFIPLLISVYYYPSLVIIAPIASVLVVYELWKLMDNSQKNIALISGIILLTVISYLFINRFQLLNPRSRGLDLAIWRDVNTVFDTNKFRGLSWNLPPTIFSFGLPAEQLANKLFLNTATANLSVFAKNYLSFFSPDWLFLRGDPILRHSTGLIGAFYPFLLPFMLYGAYRFFKSADKKTRNLFLVWILVSPIPAALTKDGAGYLLRAVTMLPFLTYFCALGLVDSFRLIKPKLRILYGIAVSLITLYSIWYFFFGYFHIYPAISGHAFESGFKELSDFQVAHDEKTMLIIWDGYYPYTQFLFWQNTPVSEYEQMKITPIPIGETTFWRTLPNLYFANPKQTIDVANFIEKYQPDYMVFPDRYFVKWSDDLLILTDEKVDQIDYLDKTTAFDIYTIRYPVLIDAINSN